MRKLEGSFQKSNLLMRRPIPLFSHFTVLFLFFISPLSYALNLTLNNTPAQVHFSAHLGVLRLLPGNERTKLKVYMDNWNKHREHSEPYQARY